MAASTRKTLLKPLISQSRTLFSTLSSSPDPLPFPSFRDAKRAIKSESDPQKLAHYFHQTSLIPRFRRNRPLFHLSVKKLAQSRRLDLVERLIEHQKSTPDSPMLKSEGFCIRLIMLYSTAGMFDQSITTFHQMEQFGCDRTEKSLCALLTASLDNKQFDQFHEFFEEIPKKIGVSPGVVSYNLLLRVLCETKSVEFARDLIKKMETEIGVSPNINSYNVLLGAYLKDENWVEFDGIVKEIGKKGLDSNLATYNNRILRLCKTKECVRASKLLDEMVSKGVNPNSASYNAIIDGFCKVGDIESAKKVLEKLLSSKIISPCSSMYNTLIWYMIKEGEFDMGLETCKEIFKRKWIPQFEAVELLVNLLVKNSKVEEAREIVKKMKKVVRGTSVDSWTKVEAALPL